MNELDEETNCLLLRVYTLLRDRASLERQYRRYSKLLQRELGVAPGKIAANLYVELMNSFK